MGRINWESCKDDMREKLLTIASLDSVLIQLFAFIAFLKTIGNNLIKSLLIGIIVFVLGVIITAIWTILVHFALPKKKEKI